jgi:hypothetical protein
MKKFLLWLVLGVMVLSTVLFALGCPKQTKPEERKVDPLTPAAGDTSGGGDAGGATDEGGE